jgi:hypothetical protein
MNQGALTAWRAFRKASDDLLARCEPLVVEMFAGVDEAYLTLLDTMDALTRTIEEHRRIISWCKIELEKERPRS